MAPRYSAPTLSQEGSTDQSARQPGAALKIEYRIRQQPVCATTRPVPALSPRSQHATKAQNLIRPKSPCALAPATMPKIPTQKNLKIILD